MVAKDLRVVSSFDLTIDTGKGILMQLLQLFLPLRGTCDTAFPIEPYARVHKTLTEKFGSLTAYTHAPAEE